MNEQQAYTIGQLAKLGGVTTKTLRHYDRIELLRPSSRSNAGYRLYSSEDGRRLAEILAYRAIDMPLNQIAQLLDGSDSSTSTPASIPASAPVALGVQTGWQLTCRTCKVSARS
ncbi:MAG: MerR family transcriptional regulator [Coriobacteriia bacterium]|nr:MerR family transcriptional regulator [Coriobacteriia bacterium]